MGLLIKTTGLEEYLDPNGGAWLKMLILGEHGAGKTRSGGTGYPKPIIADCEHGLMSVADIAVPYAAITSSADMDALLMHLKADTMKPAGKRQYETFVLDTIDSLQRLLKTERMRKERRDNMAGADWGWLGTKMSGYIEQLTNLNMNVLVHCHLKNEKDKDSDGNETLTKVAALEGALQGSVYRDFDLIGMMENGWVADDGERVLKRQIRWHSEPKYSMLRDRSGKLPRFTDVYFDERDYQQIFDAIFSGVSDLNKGESLLELDTDEDAAPASPNGGPVENATLPRAPAKKAAKKAPAKKAAVKVAEAAAATEAEAGAAVSSGSTPASVESKDEPAKDEPAKDEPSTDVQTTTDEPPNEDDAAQALVEQELGGEVIETEVGQVDTDTGEVVEPKPAAKKAAPKAAAAPAHVCGDTKPGLTPKVEGCGLPLTEANSAKVQIARLKYQVDLCEDCFIKNKKG